MTKLFPVAAVVLAVCGGTMSTDWSYSGSNGPSHWADEYPTCGRRSQSPINIISANAVPSRKRSFRFPFANYGYDIPLGSAQMTNDGHTIKVNVRALSGDFYIYGGGLRGMYVLEYFTIHFGSNSLQGSEHQVDGRSASMEVQFFHYRADLGSVENALSQRNGVVAMAYQYQAGPNDNHNLDPIIDMLDQVTYKGDSVSLNTESFTIESIMNWDATSYYRYQGSLTTPPCSESVSWIVFPEPNSISETQLAQFRTVLSTGTDETPSKTMADNFRPVQPLNGRRVYQKRY